MRHDEAFKLLLTAAPADILQAFAPDLLAAWGHPAGLQIESVELLPKVKGLRRSRFVDFAVMVRWPEAGPDARPDARPDATPDATPDASRESDGGGRAVLVLTEHFSGPSNVELSRVALYTAAMMHRHPGVPVLPVVVVGKSTAPVQNRLRNCLPHLDVLDFRCVVFQVDVECLPAWDRCRSPLLAVLSALMRDQVHLKVAFRSVDLLRRSHGSRALLANLLPLIEHLASLTSIGVHQFHQAISEEPDMISALDLFKAEGIAEGKAEGKAEGIAEGIAEGEAKAAIATIATILSCVHDGDLPRARAEVRLRQLAEQGVISDVQLAEALASMR